jgi:hypothetical protein
LSTAGWLWVPIVLWAALAQTARNAAQRSLVAQAGTLGAWSAPAPSTHVAMRQGAASIGGVWCGAGLLHEFTLEIAQQYQDFRARLVRKGRVREITGHMEGARVIADPQRNHTMELLAQGDELRIIGASGVLALAKGQFFTRAAGGSCTH